MFDSVAPAKIQDAGINQRADHRGERRVGVDAKDRHGKSDRVFEEEGE